MGYLVAHDASNPLEGGGSDVSNGRMMDSWCVEGTTGFCRVKHILEVIFYMSRLQKNYPLTEVKPNASLPILGIPAELS